MTKIKRRSIVALITALMLIVSMLSLSVSADNAQITISSPKAANTTIYTGESFTLTASGYDSTTNHIDWTSSDTSVATISKHNGVVSVVNAGAVTFTATVMDGTKPSGSGTGGGSGSNCTATSGYDAASISFTVASTGTYGYQGTGGNTMQLTALGGNAISSITAGILYAGTTISGYENTIYDPTASEGTVSFGFMMSAGTNNFSYTNFNSNCLSHITIDEYSGNSWESYCGIQALTSSSFNSTTHVITINSDASLAEGTYKITFGADVCGNNTNKKLGVPVSFIFDVVSV